jgi:UV DNA damage repair endonuclease
MSLAIQPRIGFCCTFVSPTGDAAEERRLNMRRVTLAQLARLGPIDGFEKLSEVVAHNLDALDAQLAFVAALPPLERMFRIVSGFLPGWSHAGTKHLYTDADFRRLIERRLAGSGAFARANAIRLSMHPGQHAILATKSEAALANALTDIMEHVEIMAMLGFGGGWHPEGAHVNIHGGAASAGIEGLRAGLRRLPQAARDLVTIENDELSFGVDDLLPLAEEVALVVDFHHHWIHSRGEYLEPDDPRVDRLKASWRGVRPAAHISVSRESLYSELLDEERPDYAELSAAGFKASELRGHSDMMWNLRVNDLVAEHLAWCDIEVEAKAKNLASGQLAGHVRGLELTSPHAD